MSKTCAIAAGTTLVALLSSSLFANAADECRLEIIASVKMTAADDGLVIPVSIKGKTENMVVDTGSPVTSIDARLVDDLGLATHDVIQGMYTGSGRLYTKMSQIGDVQIGQLRAGDARVLIEPEPLSDDGHIAGVLGAEFLRHYDIDLDFGAQRLNLFSQSHCPGKVVYWPAGAVAVVPMDVSTLGYIRLPVKIDGHEFEAQLATGSVATHLTLEAATNNFGLKPGSPDLQQIETSAGGTPLYKHTFKTMELEGIAVGNPTVLIQEDMAKYQLDQASHTGSMMSGVGQGEGIFDLTLGINELRHLHVFISYKDEKMYISAASAPPPAAPAAPTAGQQTPPAPASH